MLRAYVMSICSTIGQKTFFMVYTVRAVHLRGVFLFLYWSIDITVNAVGHTQILQKPPKCIFKTEAIPSLQAILGLELD